MRNPNPYQLSSLTMLFCHTIGVLVLFSNSQSTLARQFELDKNWPDHTVSDLEVYGSGIVIDSENNVIVLHRGDSMRPGAPRNETIQDDVIMIIDGRTGKILRTWGKGMFIHPHGIEVLENGDIFTTDSKYHQVFKFAYNPVTKLWNEEPVLTLGEKFVPGSDRTHFCTPAHVAVMPGNGDFYVADGYCNSRIVKFDKFGNYLIEFGAGSRLGIPSVPFNITHAVALAYSDIAAVGDPLVLVADRDNGRLQCFAANGTFLYELNHEDLGMTKTMLLGLSHVRTGTEFGLVYAVNGYLTLGQPQVFEIEVEATRARLVSSFHTSPGQSGTGMEIPHDIIASKDGRHIFVVVATPTKLILKKFTMRTEGSGTQLVSFSIKMSCLLMSVLTGYLISVQEI